MRASIWSFNTTHSMSNDVDDLLDAVAPLPEVEKDDDAGMDDGDRYRQEMLRQRGPRMRKRRRRDSDSDSDFEQVRVDDDVELGSDADFNGRRPKRPRVANVGDDDDDDDEDMVPPIIPLQGVGGAIPVDGEEEAEGLIRVREYVSVDTVSRALQSRNAGDSEDEGDDDDEELGLTARERTYCVLCHYKPAHQDDVVRRRFEDMLGILVMRYSEMDRVALGRLAKQYYDSYIRPNIDAEPYWSVDSILEHIEHHEINSRVQRVRLCRTLLTILEAIREGHLFTKTDEDGFKVDSRGVQMFVKIAADIDKLLRKLEAAVGSSS